MDDIKLQVTIVKKDCDTNGDIAKLSQQLRKDLLMLDVKNVDYLCREKSVEGTKTGDIISWETLIITLATSGGVISTFINFILGWIKRNNGRTVRLELNGNKLEVTGLSTDEQKRLIEIWLKRNGGILIK